MTLENYKRFRNALFGRLSKDALRTVKFLILLGFFGGLSIIVAAVAKQREQPRHAQRFDPAEDKDLLKLTYDAEVKKMLGYVASEISSFAAQLAIFVVVTINRPVSLPPILVLMLALALGFLECYLFVAISTKYQNLVILENRLHITEIHRDIYPMRSWYAKAWDKSHREWLGIQAGNYRRLGRILDLVILLPIFVVITVWVWIVCLSWNL
ncbi:MAG: hypothetical protein ABSD73_11855 [Candidatus Bathyarchaeia archaeon]